MLPYYSFTSARGARLQLRTLKKTESGDLGRLGFFCRIGIFTVFGLSFDQFHGGYQPVLRYFVWSSGKVEYMANISGGAGGYYARAHGRRVE